MVLVKPFLNYRQIPLQLMKITSFPDELSTLFVVVFGVSISSPKTYTLSEQALKKIVTIKIRFRILFRIIIN
jgi:hypothetical protein